MGGGVRGGGHRGGRGGRRGRGAATPKRKTEGEEKPKNSSKKEIEELESRITEQAPASGTAVPLSTLFATGDVPEDYAVSFSAATRFDQLPISERTLRGLKEGGFVEMTPIQRAAIPHALAGRDILGAACTGSG